MLMNYITKMKLLNKYAEDEKAIYHYQEVKMMDLSRLLKWI